MQSLSTYQFNDQQYRMAICSNDECNESYGRLFFGLLREADKSEMLIFVLSENANGCAKLKFFNNKKWFKKFSLAPKAKYRKQS
jgi:hypothetical protein